MGMEAKMETSKEEPELMVVVMPGPTMAGWIPAVDHCLDDHDDELEELS